MSKRDEKLEIAKAICCPGGCVGMHRPEPMCAAAMNLHDEQAEAVLAVIAKWAGETPAIEALPRFAWKHRLGRAA